MPSVTVLSDLRTTDSVSLESSVQSSILRVVSSLQSPVSMFGGGYSSSGNTSSAAEMQGGE